MKWTMAIPQSPSGFLRWSGAGESPTTQFIESFMVSHRFPMLHLINALYEVRRWCREQVC